MGKSPELDIACRPEASPVIALLIPFALLLSLPAQAAAPARADEAQRLDAVRRLYDAKEWEQAASLARGPEDQPAELDYLAGMSLGHLKRWKEARDAFSVGHRKLPQDMRFLTERAGAEYRLNDFRRAKSDLAAVLRSNPGDSYVREFLGTIYLLEENVEAALKYWNPISKPRLSGVTLEPPPALDKAIQERAVAFSAPRVLKRDEFLETNARLENLQIFPSWRLGLTNAGENDYTARVSLVEQSGWGGSWLSGILRLVRGLPYQTVYPSYFNIGREAANFTSLARWDSDKRRFAADFSLSLFRNPARRVAFFFDARNENWNLSTTFSGAAAPTADLNVRRLAGGVRIHAVQTGFWNWTSGFEMVSREFRNVPALSSIEATPFFTTSTSFEAWLELSRSLVRLPERRFTLNGTAEARFGRGFAAGLGPFGSFRGGLKADWLPKARGDDYETALRFRAGNILGNVPLDQLFQLGMERDNDLWLRGQPSTTDGRKGRAPLGRRYFLFNSEFNKTVYDDAFFRVQFGPFLDSGSIADDSGLFGSRRWLWDAGAQMKIRVLGSVSVVLIYGWDLRSGIPTFYGTTVH